MSIVLGLLCLAAVGAALLFLAVCLCALRRPPCPSVADCLLVLGARVWPDGRLSDTLLYRLDAAAAAYRRGLAPILILCGGQGSDEPVSEAAAMQQRLIALGVPAEALITENKSTTTRENLLFAAAIMAQRGQTAAVIVTSDYHMVRALWIAQRLHLSAGGVTASSPRRPLSWCKARLRECGGWLRMFLGNY